MTTTNKEEGWKNMEPWTSIEGAIWDVKGGAATVPQAMEWIHEYVLSRDTQLLQEIEGLIENQDNDNCKECRTHLLEESRMCDKHIRLKFRTQALQDIANIIRSKGMR